MPLKNFTILFVEDDRDTQAHISLLLKEEVKEFYQAFDGNEGFKLFEEKKPDIVIADINMPVCNGFEMIKQIKELDAEVPVLVMSAIDDRENLLQVINLGTSGFISKPISVELLFERLKGIVEELEQKEYKSTKIDELYTLAHYDTLTKIPNRFLFELEFSRTVESAKIDDTKVALMFVDLDNFKSINDAYGHEAGDEALKFFVSYVNKILPKNCFFSRRSGDEFMIIVKNYKNLEVLEGLVYEILDISEEKCLYKNIEFHLSCSIGVSLFPHNSTDNAELVRFSDIAMYNAKKLGKSKFSYFSTVEESNKNLIRVEDLNLIDVLRSELGEYIVEHIPNDKLEKTVNTFMKQIRNKSRKYENIIKVDHETYWNKKEKTFFYKNEEVTLTKKEKALLALLFDNINKAVSNNIITTALWVDSYEVKNESIKTLVKQLRKKIPKELIKNIFAYGYKIELREGSLESKG